MSERKHTPGPWLVSDFRSFGKGVFVGCDPIKGQVSPICDSRTFVCEMREEPKRGISAIANARLIAAAPELLEALKYARRFLSVKDHDTAYVDAAIRKALGEE